MGMVMDAMKDVVKVARDNLHQSNQEWVDRHQAAYIAQYWPELESSKKFDHPSWRELLPRQAQINAAALAVDDPDQPERPPQLIYKMTELCTDKPAQSEKSYFETSLDDYRKGVEKMWPLYKLLP